MSNEQAYYFKQLQAANPSALNSTAASGDLSELYFSALSSGQIPSAAKLRAAELVPVQVYGDSYTTSQGATDTAHGFPTRFANKINATSTTLSGVSGTTIGETLGNTLTTWGNAPAKGLIVLKSVINSVINITSAQDAVEKVAFQNALKTVLRIFRGSWVPDTDASCVYTGTWTTPSVARTNGGTAHKTSTVGDKVTITTTATEIAIITIGFPDTSDSATFSVTVNGVPYQTELNGVAQTTTPKLAWNPLSVRIAGLSGTSTVVVTNTGGGDFYFDGYITKDATPPAVIVGKEATPSITGLTINGVDTNRTAANLAIFNGYIDSICNSAEFNDGLVQVADPSPFMVQSTMYAADSLHPNNIGHAMYAYAFAIAAERLNFSAGLNL